MRFVLDLMHPRGCRCDKLCIAITVGQRVDGAVVAGGRAVAIGGRTTLRSELARLSRVTVPPSPESPEP